MSVFLAQHSDCKASRVIFNNGLRVERTGEGFSTHCANDTQSFAADFSSSLRSRKIRIRFKSLPQAKKQAPKRVPVFWRSIATALPVALFLMIIYAGNARGGIFHDRTQPLSMVAPKNAVPLACVFGGRLQIPPTAPKKRTPKRVFFLESLAYIDRISGRGCKLT